MCSMCVCLCVNKFIWVLVPIVATGIKYATAGFTVGVSHVTWVPGTKKVILQSSILNLCRHNLFMFLICYLYLYVHAMTSSPGVNIWCLPVGTFLKSIKFPNSFSSSCYQVQRVLQLGFCPQIYHSAVPKRI